MIAFPCRNVLPAWGGCSCRTIFDSAATQVLKFHFEGPQLNLRCETRFGHYCSYTHDGYHGSVPETTTILPDIDCWGFSCDSLFALEAQVSSPRLWKELGSDNEHPWARTENTLGHALRGRSALPSTFRAAFRGLRSRCGDEKTLVPPVSCLSTEPNFLTRTGILNGSLTDAELRVCRTQSR